MGLFRVKSGVAVNAHHRDWNVYREPSPTDWVFRDCEDCFDCFVYPECYCLGCEEQHWYGNDEEEESA